MVQQSSFLGGGWAEAEVANYPIIHSRLAPSKLPHSRLAPKNPEKVEKNAINNQNKKKDFKTFGFAMSQTDEQINIATLTESAQWANAVKI